MLSVSATNFLPLHVQDFLLLQALLWWFGVPFFILLAFFAWPSFPRVLEVVFTLYLFAIYFSSFFPLPKMEHPPPLPPPPPPPPPPRLSLVLAVFPAISFIRFRLETHFLSHPSLCTPLSGATKAESSPLGCLPWPDLSFLLGECRLSALTCITSFVADSHKWEMCLTGLFCVLSLVYLSTVTGHWSPPPNSPIPFCQTGPCSPHGPSFFFDWGLTSRARFHPPSFFPPEHTIGATVRNPFYQSLSFLPVSA